MTSWMIVRRRSCAVEEEDAGALGPAMFVVVVVGWRDGEVVEASGADHESTNDAEAAAAVAADVLLVPGGRRGEIWRESFRARSRSSSASSASSWSSSASLKYTDFDFCFELSFPALIQRSTSGVPRPRTDRPARRLSRCCCCLDAGVRGAEERSGEGVVSLEMPLIVDEGAGFWVALCRESGWESVEGGREAESFGERLVVDCPVGREGEGESLRGREVMFGMLRWSVCGGAFLVSSAG